MQEAKNSEKIFMLDTLMVFSGAASQFIFFCQMQLPFLHFSKKTVRPLRKLVESKGYLPVGAREFHYPSNMLLFWPDFYSKLVCYPYEAMRVRRYTKQLIAGKASWNEKFWKTEEMSQKFEKERLNPRMWTKFFNLFIFVFFQFNLN